MKVRHLIQSLNGGIDEQLFTIFELQMIQAICRRAFIAVNEKTKSESDVFLGRRLDLWRLRVLHRRMIHRRKIIMTHKRLGL